MSFTKIKFAPDSFQQIFEIIPFCTFIFDQVLKLVISNTRNMSL